MIPCARWLKKTVIAGLLLLAGYGSPARAGGDQELLVAISLDIPPYVMNHAGSGLEVEIVRQALGDYRLRFVQLSYEELQTAVQRKLANVSVGVQPDHQAVHYSDDFIAFANYAISKKVDGFRIAKVTDLRGHQVLTWENAYLELGSEFEELFSPQSPQRKNYLEIPDQEEQVRMFWAGQGRVIVIDRSIFNYFSRALGHEIAQVDYHPIFPPATNFKAGFDDAGVRDRFNEGLAAMCRSGVYAGLLQRYDVEVKPLICQ